jgi:hypothetical protein
MKEYFHTFHKQNTATQTSNKEGMCFKVRAVGVLDLVDSGAAD